jgi:hypothetical protein
LWQSHQCFSDFLFVPRADRQKLALAAPEADSLVEHAVGDLLRDDRELLEVFDQRLN